MERAEEEGRLLGVFDWTGWHVVLGVVEHPRYGRAPLHGGRQPFHESHGLGKRNQTITSPVDGAVTRELFSKSYEDVYAGPAAWQAIPASGGATRRSGSG